MAPDVYDEALRSSHIELPEVRIQDITGITEYVETELESVDCPMDQAAQINIAVDELFSNIVKFAYGGKKGPAVVSARKTEDPKGIEIVFIDRGVPYDPLSREDPDVTLPAEQRQIGGLGIYMVKQLMDSVEYEYRDGCNVLKIRKCF